MEGFYPVYFDLSNGDDNLSDMTTIVQGRSFSSFYFFYITILKDCVLGLPPTRHDTGSLYIQPMMFRMGM